MTMTVTVNVNFFGLDQTRIGDSGTERKQPH